MVISEPASGVASADDRESIVEYLFLPNKTEADELVCVSESVDLWEITWSNQALFQLPALGDKNFGKRYPHHE